MAVKQWLGHLRPLPLYLVLAITFLFFLVQLVVSHMTHALTLLVNSYHMLCNLVALIGCVVTIKCSQDEGHLRNTFGWARVNVLVMLIGCVLLSSLCFCLVVEALQTLVHIQHHDEMHHPLPVLCVGVAGLFLNGLCYLLLGGYTFQQGNSLQVTQGASQVAPQERQGAHGVARDISGCFLVMVCALIVYYTNPNVAKFVDPGLAILSAILLLILSYPYMRESGLILLQTIPGTLNMESLHRDLLTTFPCLVNVHDLHVWRLTAGKVICTAHIILLDTKEFSKTTKDVTEFFQNRGITQVTLQPEFFQVAECTNVAVLPQDQDMQCLVRCRGVQCLALRCCIPPTEVNKKAADSIPV